MPIETMILEVGDVVYDYEKYSHELIRLTVTKTTPKQAIAGIKKVSRQIEMTSIWNDVDKKKTIVKWIGQYGHAEVETAELKRTYVNEQLIKRAKRYLINVDHSLLTIENALLLIEILEPLQKPK